MCPLYVAGLIGPGARKSLQPLAARVAPADYDQLHHFVAVSPWDEAPLDAELLAQAMSMIAACGCGLRPASIRALARKTSLMDRYAPRWRHRRE